MVRPGSRKTVAAATDCSRTHRSGYQHRFSTRRRRVPSGARTLRTRGYRPTGHASSTARRSRPGPGLGTVRRTGRGLAEHLGQLGKRGRQRRRGRGEARRAARRRAGRRPAWPGDDGTRPAPGAPRPPRRPARCRPSSAAAPPPPRRAARPPRRGPEVGPHAHRLVEQLQPGQHRGVADLHPTRAGQLAEHRRAHAERLREPALGDPQPGGQPPHPVAERRAVQLALAAAVAGEAGAQACVQVGRCRPGASDGRHAPDARTRGLRPEAEREKSASHLRRLRRRARPGCGRRRP